MMNRCLIIMLATATVAVCPAQAQDNPLSTEAQQAWTRTQRYVVAAAEKMPEANYSFKPAPESQSFGTLIAHTANSALGACSGFNGERKRGSANAAGPKADLVAALKAAMAECDKAYGSLTDAKATEMIEGRRGSRTRLGTLYRNVIHIEHEYAQLAVHMRLKGIVPPSSEGR